VQYARFPIKELELKFLIISFSTSYKINPSPASGMMKEGQPLHHEYANR
jgi:hypothetical protein